MSVWGWSESTCYLSGWRGRKRSFPPQGKSTSGPGLQASACRRGGGWFQFSSKLPGDEAEGVCSHTSLSSPSPQESSAHLSHVFLLLSHSPFAGITPSWRWHPAACSLQQGSVCHSPATCMQYVCAVLAVKPSTVQEEVFTGSRSRLQVWAVFVEMSNAEAKWIWALIYRVAAFSQWPFIPSSSFPWVQEQGFFFCVFVVQEFEVKQMYCWPALRLRKTAGGLETMANSS